MFIKLKTKKHFCKNGTNQNPPQIFDLLQLSRKEREYKILCRSAIAQFDRWKKLQKASAAPIIKTIAKVEGILLRRRAEDAVMFYKHVRNDRIRAFQDYVDYLPDMTYFSARRLNRN